jgi:hypothetical protein
MHQAQIFRYTVKNKIGRFPVENLSQETVVDHKIITY